MCTSRCPFQIKPMIDPNFSQVSFYIIWKPLETANNEHPSQNCSGECQENKQCANVLCKVRNFSLRIIY